MNRDYSSPGYVHFTELAPAHPYHQYDMPQAGSSAPPYDERAAAATMPHHDQRKRRADHFGGGGGGGEGLQGAGGCEPHHHQAPPMPAPTPRRRKPSSFGTGSAYDDDDGEDSRSTRTQPDKKQNHSEIEKRRRDKMNTYISELSAMIPTCSSMTRKLDKLTVLRLAVQYLRSVRGAQATGPLAACPRPAYVTERELNDLVLAASRDCFLLVVGCDRGRLLYASSSVSHLLHYDKLELLGQSLFDILHPKDVAKVKEQLSASDIIPRERLIDARTMLPVKGEPGVTGARRLCPGARRSFFCRIKCKSASTSVVKEEHDPAAAKLRKKTHEKKYCVVHCTGYLKVWAGAEGGAGAAGGAGGEAGSGGEEEGSTSCLVAVGRALHLLTPPPPAPRAPPARPMTFFSRHAPDGKFVFVDQRVTLALGYLPQEVLGTSLYEYVSAPDLAAVARTHKAALQRRAPLCTPPYSVARKDGAAMLLQTHFKPCRNPWTKDVEFLVARNTVLSDHMQPHASLAFHGHHQGAAWGRADGAEADAEADAEVQRLIDSQVESHKIGSAIAEEALRRSPNTCTLDLPPELLHDALFNSPLLRDVTLPEPLDDPEEKSYRGAVRNNVSLSMAAAEGAEGVEGAEGGGEAGAGGGAGGEEEAPCSPGSMSLDGNSEAAMAVIMSLLEADAGLGGPVNFSGLPWPLP